jgi:hypothetical protein
MWRQPNRRPQATLGVALDEDVTWMTDSVHQTRVAVDGFLSPRACCVGFRGPLRWVVRAGAAAQEETEIVPATSAARRSIVCDVRGVCRCVRQAAVGDLRICAHECDRRRGVAEEGARPLVPNPVQHIGLVSALRYVLCVCCLCTCTAVAAGAALR